MVFVFCLSWQLYRSQGGFTESTADTVCCFDLTSVSKDSVFSYEQLKQCCDGHCCEDIRKKIKDDPASLRKYYDHLRILNARQYSCCRGELHRIQLLLMKSIRWGTSRKKLFAVFGEPDHASRKFTSMERFGYYSKFPPGKRFLKKIYRYEGTVPGRIYLIFITRFGRVIYKKVYVDVC